MASSGDAGIASSTLLSPAGKGIATKKTKAAAPADPMLWEGLLPMLRQFIDHHTEKESEGSDGNGDIDSDDDAPKLKEPKKVSKAIRTCSRSIHVCIFCFLERSSSRYLCLHVPSKCACACVFLFSAHDRRDVVAASRSYLRVV